MAKYKLLIIDDDLENRKNGYTAVLGNEYFDFEFIEKADGKELEKIRTANVHGFILDVNLSKWVNDKPEDMFRVVVELIGKRGPLFLISNRWDQAMIQWVNKSKNTVNIVHYISWDNDIQEFLHAEKEGHYINTRENIKSELDHHYEKEPTILGSDEKINILHISDLQFGDKSYSDSAIFLEKLIPKYLKQGGITVNLIVASGDIAYSGIPSEYSLAEKWFTEFCTEILGTNFKSRLLLIPGNHDVNLRLAAADMYNYNFDSRRLVELNGEDQTGEHHFYGLAPFREFAFKMTDNPIWMINQNLLCFANDRFLNWGVRFYHFNSVIRQDCDQPKRVEIPEHTLREVMAAPKVGPDIYKIILSHHGPEDLGYHLASPSEPKWSHVRNFIEWAEPQLYLHGHVHGFKTYPISGIGRANREMECHMTSTLSLEKEKRMKDGLRGFSLIELERRSGVVKKHKIREFEIVEERIRERRK